MPRHPDDDDLAAPRWGIALVDTFAAFERDELHRACDVLYASSPADATIATLRPHATVLLVALGEAQRRGGLHVSSARGLDDAMLEAADAIARLIDPGAG